MYLWSVRLLPCLLTLFALSSPGMATSPAVEGVPATSSAETAPSAVATSESGPTVALEPSSRATPHPLETVQVDAPRGGWWREDGAFLKVFSAESDRVTARRLVEHGNTSLPPLAEKMGVDIGGAVDIYIAPTQEMFQKGQPGEPPRWADGTAWPAHGLVFLRAPSLRPGTAAPLEQVLDHELVHVLLGRAVAPRSVPRWLQEGMAEFYAGELGPDRAKEIISALGGAGLLPLSELGRSFPGDPARAKLAYAQSVDLIAFIESTYGPQTLKALIAASARGEGIHEALLSATGEDPAVIEKRWLSRWSDPWLSASSFLNGDLIGLVALPALLIGAWRIRSRNRRKVERWEKEERERIARMFPHGPLH